MKQSETNLEKKGEKGEANYHCNICDYTSCIKFSYERHLMTSKHNNQVQKLTNETNETKNETKKNKKEKKEKYVNIICNCGKVYYSRTTLWRHKKKCNFIEKSNEQEIINNNDTTDKDELINYLIKENKEFKNLILEIVKKDTYNNSNNTTNNSHNKTFNLQFFLNETCKDAMNIMDFVDSIKLQLSDLEKVGKNGFVEGISSIIVKNLNSLDENKRPVHCTDSKREVMYVKDEDKWEKENEEKMKLRKAIKKVAHKNSKMLCEFRSKNPDCLKSTSKISDQYNKLVIEAMGGKGDNDLEKEDKIIKNIAKEVVINKHNMETY
jgi:hypothetical protein